MGLTRLLYQRGYSREQVVELFHFIGWMIRLPKPLEYQLIEAVKVVEEEYKMPYINTVEQYGIEKGIEQAEKRFEQERLKAAQERQEAEVRVLQERRETVRQLLSVNALNNLIIFIPTIFIIILTTAINEN